MLNLKAAVRGTHTSPNIALGFVIADRHANRHLDTEESWF